MDEPTPRQLEVLRYVAEYCGEHGYSPSLREMVSVFRWASTNSAQDHMYALRRKGLLTWKPTSSRTVRLTPLGHSLLSEGRASHG